MILGTVHWITETIAVVKFQADPLNLTEFGSPVNFPRICLACGQGKALR